MTIPTPSRRDFVKTTAVAASSVALSSITASRVLGTNERIRMGVIGME